MKSQGPLTLALIISLFTVDALIGADPVKKAAASAKAEQVETLDVSVPETVAIVEGAEIKKAELETALNAVLAQQSRSPADIPPEQKPQVYRMVLDDMIIDKLIASRSAKLKVEDSEVDAMVSRLKKNFGSEEEFKGQIEKMGQTLEKVKDNIRTNLRQQHWVEEQVKGKAAVTNSEAEEFYKKNTEQFKQPEQVRASHILLAIPQDAKPEVVVEKEMAAKAVLERVKKGEAFDKVAKEVSEDPSAKENSGDLSYFAREQMVPEFSEAAFKMKQDEVSTEPVRSQFGYHIIKVTGRKEAETVPFDKAKPQLMTYLENQKKQQEIEKVVKDIRAKADIKVNLPEAPPPAPAASPDAPATTPKK